MTKITKFEYSLKIENAINITNDKKIDEPNNPMYSHIEKLLNSIKDIVNENLKVSDEGNVGNELGMLVVRRIDDEDPDYGDILIEISDKFESDYIRENTEKSN